MFGVDVPVVMQLLVAGEPRYIFGGGKLISSIDGYADRGEVWMVDFEPVELHTTDVVLYDHEI